MVSRWLVCRPAYGEWVCRIGCFFKGNQSMWNGKNVTTENMKHPVEYSIIPYFCGKELLVIVNQLFFCLVLCHVLNRTLQFVIQQKLKQRQSKQRRLFSRKNISSFNWTKFHNRKTLLRITSNLEIINSHEKINFLSSSIKTKLMKIYILFHRAFNQPAPKRYSEGRTRYLSCWLRLREAVHW